MQSCDPNERPRALSLLGVWVGVSREILEISNKFSVGERIGQITHLNICTLHYNTIVMEGGPPTGILNEI
jgi:hypothetical protein